MYIKREYIPGLRMFVYVYDNKEEAEEMSRMCEFSKVEYDEISNTWKVKIW